MDVHLRLKSLVGGEHEIGTVRWRDGWQVTGDIAWVMELHAVLPAGIDPVAVGPDDGEDFLYALWFTIRGSAVWAELVSDDARAEPLSPAEAMEEAERRGRARVG
jgi:hypothetical protein